MDDITLSEARENLEDVLQRVARGEDVRISAPEIGTIKLMAVVLEGPVSKERARPKRVPGQWKDKLAIPARLFEPLSDDELVWLSGEQSK